MTSGIKIDQEDDNIKRVFERVSTSLVADGPPDGIYSTAIADVLLNFRSLRYFGDVGGGSETDHGEYEIRNVPVVGNQKYKQE